MASNSSVTPSDAGSTDYPSSSQAATTNTAPTTPTTSSAGYSNEQFAGFLNLAFLAFVLFFFLLSLPRAIARLHHPGAWRTGWLLKPRKSYIRRARDAIRKSLHLGPAAPSSTSLPTMRQGLVTGAAPYAWGDDSEDGHGKSSSSGHGHSVPPRRVNKRGTAIAPSHVPSWATLFYPVSSTFAMRFPGTRKSVAQVFVYAVYAAMFLAVAFVMTSGQISVARAGWLVVGNFPVMVGLGSKNGLIAMLVGSNYAKVGSQSTVHSP